ncbi:hypothetical protein KPH14_009834 [Odynerus spinipes]|uniref:Uncharacterized protein n=1 Tax=Odynerus spinipes TaxID=1348599 RepID=A0AAD9RVX3_9HYME|nr:hypothetical protein KPH14_009834 [Odynerus spinipes]
MDETVAKREARRKRILENSERRLQRIVGKNNPNELEDVSNKITSLNVQSNTLELEANGISVNKAFIEDENDALYLQGDIIMEQRGNTSSKSYFGLNNEDTSSVLSNSYNCSDIINDKYGCTDKKSNMKHFGSHESTEYLQEKNISNYPLQTNICNRSSLSGILLSNHISYIVLAVIVNVLLMCNMDYLFGKGIIVPCFIMMLARLCICTSIQEPQHGSPLIAALILLCKSMIQSNNSYEI